MKKVPKFKKRKGYYTGGDVDEYGNQIQRDANGNPITSGANMLDAGGTEFKTTGDYTPSMKEGTTSNISSDSETSDTTQKKSGAAENNKLGKAAGAYGTGYYASKEPKMKGDNIRSGAFGAIGQMGGIGGAIAGGAALGDQIGEPIKAKSEETDAYGNLKDKGAAQRNAIGGGLFSPSKALQARASYKGGWTDVTGKGYTNYSENQAKQNINEQGIDNAMQARDEGQTMVSSNTVNVNQPKKKTGLAKAGAVFGFKKGGEIVGKGTGTSDSINAELEEGGFVVPAKNNWMAEAIRKNVLKDNPKKKASLHKGEVPVKVSDGEHFFTEDEKEEIVDKTGEETLEALAPEAEENENELAKGTTKDGVIDSKKPPVKTVEKKTYKKPLPKTNPFVAQETITPITPSANLSTTETNDALREIDNVNSNAVDTNPVSSKPSETKEVSSAGNFWDKVNSVNTGNLLNTGLGAFQVGMGLKGLKGERPVQELDKTFNANVNKAQAQAEYGLSPEQRFLIDQQNQNALNQEIFAAKNFAGGSASNAYNMTRSALNNAFTRNLQTQVTDTGLQQDKQAMANQLALQRANMSRAIFEDSLNAFSQKQQSAGNLLGAGIGNLMDANRFNQYMKLRDKEQDFKQQYT